MPTFSPGPPLAWGTFSPQLPHLMTDTDFPDLTLSFGRTKPPPSTLILYHPPLLPTPAPLHKKFQTPPPFSTSLASTKCFLLTFFNAHTLTRLIGWLPTLPSLSHTSALSIFRSSKLHKSSVPSMPKFVSRFFLDKSMQLLLIVLLSYLLLPPQLLSNLGF